MKDTQIKEIHDLLLAYAAGEYNKKGKVSKEKDEIDMIIAGVNMLGEELSDTTVSRDYFNSIYSSVADMIFVIATNGTIKDVNNSVEKTLKISSKSLLGNKLNTIVKSGGRSFFAGLKKGLNDGQASYKVETQLLTSDQVAISVDCSCSRIIDKNMKFTGYLLIAEDITERKEAQRLILRTIVDTQEREQLRVSEDLHDSLGSDLSTVMLLLSVLGEQFSTQDKKFVEVFESCRGTLEDSIDNLRSICFDLMPASLEKGNIHIALDQLIDKHSLQGLINFSYSCKGNLPELEKSLETVIYRIAQEFINNSIKHANATKVNVKLLFAHETVTLSITDNGKGFDISNPRLSKGRGLNNMDSRTKAFNGRLWLTSKISKGTKLKVTFPSNNENG